MAKRQLRRKLYIDQQDSLKGVLKDIDDCIPLPTTRFWPEDRIVLVTVTAEDVTPRKKGKK
jgi:hypothetical protein